MARTVAEWGFPLALALSLGLHLGLLATWTALAPPAPPLPLHIRIVAQEREQEATPSRPPQSRKKTRRADSPAQKQPASMPAPPPPSAEEWQLASTYTLKNSKRYRYNWGQLVRSKMGTAVEGPDQGLVRLRIKIAPDGKIAKIEQLWATSEKAAKLAWQAIQSLPPLPPTPTGKPLIFEQTISFLPFETGWPPSYKLDCLPDPPVFQNPFVWDGSSPRPTARTDQENTAPADSAPPPTDCVTDSTADSIEEEERELKRQLDQSRWGR